MIPLYFRDGTLFADDYVRVVQGGRGDYVELTKEQIKVTLKSKWNQPLPENVSNEEFYYYWLVPIGRDEKIYWQVQKVNYADYKVGLYYVNPMLFKTFKRKF